MRKTIILSGLTVALSACGSGQPNVTASSPRLEATVEHVWDAGDGPGRGAAFSSDGRFLATTAAGGDVIVRRAADWRVVRRLKHPGGATAVAFVPGSRSLFASGYDGTVRAWNVGTGKAGGTLTDATGTLWTLDISPDGTMLAAAGEDGVARLWSLAGREAPRALRGHSRNIWEVRFAPTGTHLATASFDNTARIWDVASGKTLATLRGHSQAIVGLDYHPHGHLLATSGDDSTIRLWRTSDGEQRRKMEGGNHVYDVAFSPDGKWLASAGRARSVIGGFWYDVTGLGGSVSPVKLWRVADGALVASLPHPTDVMYATFSPDGRYLVTSSEDSKVRLWRLAPRR